MISIKEGPRCRTSPRTPPRHVEHKKTPSLVYFCVSLHHISPRSVSTYLSGVVQQLEPFHPLIQEICNSKLVQRTLQGCLKIHAQPPHRKRTLSVSDLSTVVNHYQNTPPSHDNLLFVSMLLTGFFLLMRLGKMAFPDESATTSKSKIGGKLAADERLMSPTTVILSNFLSIKPTAFSLET